MQMNKKPHVKPYGAGGKSQDDFDLLFSPELFDLFFRIAWSYGLLVYNQVVVLNGRLIIMLCNRWYKAGIESPSKCKE